MSSARTQLPGNLPGPDDPSGARVEFGELQNVPIEPVEHTYADLYAARAATNDGKHAWVVRLLFELKDPEVSLDDMVCGPDNMIGIMPITCFWCGIEYPRDGFGVALQATWCPGRPADSEPEPVAP